MYSVCSHLMITLWLTGLKISSFSQFSQGYQLCFQVWNTLINLILVIFLKSLLFKGADAVSGVILSEYYGKYLLRHIHREREAETEIPVPSKGLFWVSFLHYLGLIYFLFIFYFLERVSGGERSKGRENLFSFF